MNALKRSSFAAVALLGAKAMGACTGTDAPDINPPSDMYIDYNTETTFEWTGWLTPSATSTYVLYGGGVVKANWQDAQQSCEDTAYMCVAKSTNKDENAAIQAQCVPTGDDCWLAGFANTAYQDFLGVSPVENEWRWVDGSGVYSKDGKAFPVDGVEPKDSDAEVERVYNDWGTHSFNPANNKCMTYYASSLSWYSMLCTREFPYICKQEWEQATTTLALEGADAITWLTFENENQLAKLTATPPASACGTTVEIAHARTGKADTSNTDSGTFKLKIAPCPAQVEDFVRQVAPLLFSAGGLLGWALSSPAAASELASGIADVAEDLGYTKVADDANAIAAILDF